VALKGKSTVKEKYWGFPERKESTGDSKEANADQRPLTV